MRRESLQCPEEQEDVANSLQPKPYRRFEVSFKSDKSTNASKADGRPDNSKKTESGQAGCRNLRRETRRPKQSWVFGGVREEVVEEFGIKRTFSSRLTRYLRR